MHSVLKVKVPYKKELMLWLNVFFRKQGVYAKASLQGVRQRPECTT